MIIDGKDKALISLLQSNGRMATAELARKLGMSRTTVSARIERLEKRGIITGYTVRLGESFERGRIQANVMISSDPKLATQIVARLKKVPEIRTLHAVNGSYEMMALVDADSPQELDEVLDAIGNTRGINKTNSSILLSTKILR